MKRLNNRGWGMTSFLIIIGLLFFLILLIALMANEYDNGLPSSRRSELGIKQNLE
jgi:hypothetical protein